MIRTKGEAGSGNIVEAVRHIRTIVKEMKQLTVLGKEELVAESKKLQAPLELRYDDRLLKAWKVYRLRRRAVNEPRGRFHRLVFGSSDEQFAQARSRLCLQYALYLFNLWKTAAPGNFRSLISYLLDHPEPPAEKEDVDMTVLDVLLAVVRHVAAGLASLGQQSLLDVEMDRLARQPAFAHEIAHAQFGSGATRRGPVLRRAAVGGVGFHVE